MPAIRVIIVFCLLTAPTVAQSSRRSGASFVAAADLQAGIASKAGAKSRTANAGEKVDVERIFERFFEAQGGVAEMSKVQTRIMRATVEHSQFKSVGSWSYYAKSPNKQLSVLKVPSGEQFVEGFDGRDAWLQSPLVGAIQFNQDSVVILDRSSEFVRKKATEMYSSVSYKGRASIGGQEAHVIDAARKGHPPQTLYFDVASGLLVRVDILIPLGGEEKLAPASVYFDRYAEIDGIKLPVVIRNVYREFTLIYKIFEIKHNVEISDALFNLPHSAPAK